MPARGWEPRGVLQCQAGQDEDEDERRPGFAGAPVSFLESGPARAPRSVPKPLSVAERASGMGATLHGVRLR